MCNVTNKALCVNLVHFDGHSYTEFLCKEMSGKVKSLFVVTGRQRKGPEDYEVVITNPVTFSFEMFNKN